MTDQTGTLIIEPKIASIGSLTLTSNTFNFCINFGFESQNKTTTPAMQSGSLLQWNDAITFTYKKADFDGKKDNFILCEIRQYTQQESYQFIGRNVYNLSKVYGLTKHIVTIDLFDTKSTTRMGFLELQVSFISADETIANRSKLTNIDVIRNINTPLNFPSKMDKIISTFIITPLYFKFDDFSQNLGQINPYFSFYYGEQAFRTSLPIWDGQNYKYDEIISFLLYQDQSQLKIYCSYLDNNTNDYKDLGIAKLDIETLVATGKPINRNSIPIKDKEKLIGLLFYNFEVITDIFPKPPKAYPIVSIFPNELKGFKIKYQNRSNRKKLYTIVSPDTNIVNILSPDMELDGNDFGEIKFSMKLPIDSEYSVARIDIWNKDRNEIEESLLFRLRRKIK